MAQDSFDLPLDVWIEGVDSSDGEVRYRMYSLFDEYCDGGICTASVRFKYADGVISNWYHPTKTTLADTPEDYLW